MSSPLPCIWAMFKCSRGIATTGMTNLVLERDDPLARPEPVSGGVGEAVAEHHGVVLVVRGDRALEARRAGPKLQIRA